MSLELQVLAAICVDRILGDPRWLPHPVRFIGKLAMLLENPFRKIFPRPELAGAAAVVTVLCVTGSIAWLVLATGYWLHEWVGYGFSIFFLYTCIAARDLEKHSSTVLRALEEGDLYKARHRVGMLVGRDTDALDEAEVIRATVESVAENTVDGVTAPIFYAFIGGPALAMVYKAVNTLDSTFGYKNERYRQFGWTSARLDDAANFIPARITALLVPLAAVLLRLDSRNALRVFWRDRKKHPSPNGGQIEAAVAGALKVQLGGMNTYDGITSFRPQLGDPLEFLQPVHILQVNRLMWMAALLAAGLAMLVHWSIVF